MGNMVKRWGQNLFVQRKVFDEFFEGAMPGKINKKYVPMSYGGSDLVEDEDGGIIETKKAYLYQCIRNMCTPELIMQRGILDR